MNRIEMTLKHLKTRNEAALVGFVTAGDPTLDQSQEICHAMVRGGLDIIELGVPFSDPTADGPVIQRSSMRAIKGGATLSTVFQTACFIRTGSSLPIIVFSYYNPIFTYGVEKFYHDAVNAGVDGVLIVDLPPEESDEMTKEWPNNELSLIRLIAPTTPRHRIASIAEHASGFLYCVSMTGVTGSDNLDYQDVAHMVRRVKRETSLPVCVGFGISTPEHVRTLSPLVEGVVVGSAFERLIEEHMDDPELPKVIEQRVRLLKQATQ